MVNFNDISKEIKTEITQLVNSFKKLNKKIEKTGDIYADIRAGYYSNTKYKYMSRSSEDYKTIVNVLETIAMKNSDTISEASEKLTLYKKFANNIMDKVGSWNNDTIEEDIQNNIWSNIPERMYSTMWNMMDAIDPDTYNKPVYAEDIAEMVNEIIRLTIN